MTGSTTQLTKGKTYAASETTSSRIKLSPVTTAQSVRTSSSMRIFFYRLITNGDQQIKRHRAGEEQRGSRTVVLIKIAESAPVIFELFAERELLSKALCSVM